MSQFNRFSNRERVEPSTPRNVYRQNNQFDEQQPFVREDVYLSLIAQRDDALMRYQALHAAYELSVSRSEAMQHNNQDMAAHLEASRQQVDQLYARANALQRELQVATIGSRACADAVSQSTSCFAELQRVNQQHADLQQEYNKLHRDYDTQRQSRRAAEHQLDHQATKYQAMKARVASDAGVISDFRVNVKKLNEKIAQLEAAAQVRELRVLVSKGITLFRLSTNLDFSDLGAPSICQNERNRAANASSSSQKFCCGRYSHTNSTCTCGYQH